MGTTSEKYKEFAPVIVIIAACFLVYFNALSNGFVYDDWYLVVWNTLIKGLRNIPAIFTTGYWHTKGDTGGLYRPLTMLSFAFEHSLFRLNPFIYHLDNVILHTLCSLLVYFISKSILKDRLASFTAAIIFAVHPLHTEVVAWVSGRAELLSVFFCLWSMLIFIKRPGKPSAVLFSAFVFFLALLAKETAITLPLLFALYIFLYDRPDSGRALLTRLTVRLSPYIAAFIIYFIARETVLKGRIPPPENSPLYLEGPYQRFLTMSQALYEYIRLSFVPTNLSVDYYFMPRSILNIKVLFSIFLVISLVVLSRRIARSHKNVFFALLLFFIALLPVSNIIPIGIIMSERAAYFPSMGACMLLGMAISWGENQTRSRFRVGSIGLSTMVLAAILGSYTALTVARNPYWKDPDKFILSYIEIMKKRIKEFPNSPVFHANLGNVLVMRGDYGPETEKALKEAIRLYPGNPNTHCSLAMVYAAHSRTDEALSEIQATFDLDPSNELLYMAGETLFKLGRKDEAVRILDEAIELNPSRAAYYTSKALMYMAEGEEDTAMSLLDKAISLDPDVAVPYIKQGIILGRRKDFRGAINKIKTALELDPDRPDAHYYLAIAYIGTRDFALADEELKTALKLNPGYKDASDLLNRIRR